MFSAVKKMKMHLQSDISCELAYPAHEMEKIQVSEEAEMLYYELISAMEEEEKVRPSVGYFSILLWR